MQILLQGHSLPPPTVISAVPLLPSQTRPTEPPPPPEDPLTFPDAEDTTGLARVRMWGVRHDATPASTPAPNTFFPADAPTSTSTPTAVIPATTISTPPAVVNVASPSILEEEPSNVGASVTVSRTTGWRHRKANEAWKALQQREASTEDSAGPPPAKRRKPYTCHLCAQMMNKGLWNGDLTVWNLINVLFL